MPAVEGQDQGKSVVGAAKDAVLNGLENTKHLTSDALQAIGEKMVGVGRTIGGETDERESEGQPAGEQRQEPTSPPNDEDNAEEADETQEEETTESSKGLIQSGIETTRHLASNTLQAIGEKMASVGRTIGGNVHDLKTGETNEDENEGDDEEGEEGTRGEKGGAAKEKAQDTKEAVAEKAGGVKEAAKEKAQDAKEAVAEKAGGVKEAAKEKAQDAKEAVAEKAGGVKETAGGAKAGNEKEKETAGGAKAGNEKEKEKEGGSKSGPAQSTASDDLLHKAKEAASERGRDARQTAPKKIDSTRQEHR